MYRKRNGSLGFSFTRFANAAVPNFFADPPASRIASLIPLRQDMCYAHQLASNNAYAFDERTIYVSGITDSEGMSKKVFKALQKHDILKEDGTVDTHKIGSRFTHQVAMLTIVRQRELIDLLFWWEEECQRLRKLEAEEKELDEMIALAEEQLAESSDDTAVKERLDQLKFARERVRMKRRQRPSQRNAEVEADKDDIAMAFHGRSKSAPTLTNTGPNAKPERPPEYYGGRY